MSKDVKGGQYVINLDEYSDVGTHWIVLCILDNDTIYFDSFGIERIPKEIRLFIRNKNIETNIFRIQANNSIICGYFCIGFIDFMLAGKTLIDYTSLFSLYNFEKKKKKTKLFSDFLKMNEARSMHSNLSIQVQFRLKKISKIK